jgi:hypothetical protein
MLHRCIEIAKFGRNIWGGGGMRLEKLRLEAV